MVRFVIFRHLLASAVLLFPLSGFAQSTPSEFAEMSLQELFALSTQEDLESTDNWSWSLRHHMAEFEGYLDGSEKLTLDEVLFSPGSEPRSAKNFPVVPTLIKQRATVLGVNYQWNELWQVSLALPYIQQETDHISVVPGYQQFLIKSHGVGDITLASRYRLHASADKSLYLNLGVSLPVGSIDEQGDTPRAPGEQQLPYTMQLGSGTWDFPLTLTYRLTGAQDIRLDATAIIRTGKNDRDYRLGNRFSIKGKYQVPLMDKVKTAFGVELTQTNSIQGGDESLLVPMQFPYPASITNPDMYGGRKVLASIALTWQFSEQLNLSFEFAKPLYQYLNGPQPRERWRGGLMVFKSL